MRMQLSDAPTFPYWQTVGIKHHHGIALPLFSIRTEKSSGIGEFYDLLPLLDFCKEVNFDTIQLLPLNDTGLDCSPYNAISAKAINPIHLSLHALPGVEKVPSYREKLIALSLMNEEQRIDYTKVREGKNKFLEEYVSLLYDKLIHEEPYLQFIKANKWVKSFALFKTLKESQKWRSWETWPTSLRSPSEKQFPKLFAEHETRMAFHIVLQFLSFGQMEEVKKRASEKGILIKGDIPILLSRDSADVWHEKQFFLTDLQAGAPPDFYAEEGQSWGFPLFDWEALEKEDYSFWKERLALASKLYHLYRIDHVVGLFRIWAIPMGRKGVEGYFFPNNEKEWIPHGKKILEKFLKSAPLLPIAEDLGTIPPEVRKTLHSLGICGTKVIRWERDWEGDGNFIPYDAYDPISMTTVSTHDSDTLQLWWRHAPKEAKLFSEFKGWDYTPFLSLERHREILLDSHRTTSLFHINPLQEYLALFPELVSSNPNDERINTPGKVLSTNWTYKFRPSVETLSSHSLLKETLRSFSK